MPENPLYALVYPGVVAMVTMKHMEGTRVMKSGDGWPAVNAEGFYVAMGLAIVGAMWWFGWKMDDD